MKHQDQIDLIDNILLAAIAKDIVSGTLLEADEETLAMILTGIWEDKAKYEAVGIVIGEA
tara:strand:+ start:489 stop:668 length:180 start_codon:yes stop_codon:yes gene_type:complete